MGRHVVVLEVKDNAAEIGIATLELVVSASGVEAGQSDGGLETDATVPDAGAGGPADAHGPDGAWAPIDAATGDAAPGPDAATSSEGKLIGSCTCTPPFSSVDPFGFLVLAFAFVLGRSFRSDET